MDLCDKLEKEEVEKLAQEYYDVPMMIPDLSHEVALKEENYLKNRYENVIPYDYSRQVLRLIIYTLEIDIILDKKQERDEKCSGLRTPTLSGKLFKITPIL